MIWDLNKVIIIIIIERSILVQVRPEYSGPLLELDRSDRNLPIHFDKPVHCPTSLQKIKTEIVRAIALGLPGFIGKFRFILGSCTGLWPVSSIIESTSSYSHILRRCHAATGLLGDMSIWCQCLSGSPVVAEPITTRPITSLLVESGLASATDMTNRTLWRRSGGTSNIIHSL